MNRREFMKLAAAVVMVPSLGGLSSPVSRTTKSAPLISAQVDFAQQYMDSLRLLARNRHSRLKDVTVFGGG
jgi:hypothetical protein